jgi:protease I
MLVLAADLFEDVELLYPVYRLGEEGVSVTVAGLDDRPVTGKKGHGPVPATVEEVCEQEYDALVIPGGYAPDRLRRSPRVLELVKAFDAQGKPIAFICHAGWVLISAKILKGRWATSFGAIRDDMENAGVNWVDEATVVDGNLISARGPRTWDRGLRRCSRRCPLHSPGAARSSQPPARTGYPARCRGPGQVSAKSLSNRVANHGRRPQHRMLPDSSARVRLVSP